MADTNDIKTVVVRADESSTPYSAGALCFFFSALCFLFWANMMGFLGPDTTLALGCAQLGVFGAYLWGAKNLFKMNNGFEGNVYLIFAALFGGVGGLTNVLGPFAATLGIPMAASAAGLVYLLSGILLLLLIPCAVKFPKVGFFFYITGGIAMTLNGLISVGLLSMAFLPVCAWFIFAVGALAFYFCLSAMFAFVGKNIPLGEPFSK